MANKIATQYIPYNNVIIIYNIKNTNLVVAQWRSKINMVWTTQMATVFIAGI